MGAGVRQEEDGGGESAPQVSISRLATLGSGSGLFGREADTAWLDACWSTGASVASVVAFGGEPGSDPRRATQRRREIAAVVIAMVDVTSLEHDLGNDTRTGCDVLTWIEEAVATRRFVPSTIAIHSADAG